MRIDFGDRTCEVVIESGAVGRIGEHLRHTGKVLVVTDDGVPVEYARKVCEAFGDARIMTLPRGERSKSFEVYISICEKLLSDGFTRGDAIVSVGGGVVCDVAGFAAATYMRGIELYSVPTTLLAQVDASVGGKNAVDVCGIKNAVGTFYQPKKVVIDPELLSTLGERELACGFAEIIKIAVTLDADLFRKLERGVGKNELPLVISRAVEAKARIVAADEKDRGERRVLNFGHTLGHGIESCTDHLHGECVALGMLCMCSETVFGRLSNVLEKYGLPTCADVSESDVSRAVLHDKKSNSDGIVAVFAEEIGKYEFLKITADDISERIKRIVRM